MMMGQISDKRTKTVTKSIVAEVDWTNRLLRVIIR
jgi:hypothetical protein